MPRQAAALTPRLVVQSDPMPLYREPFTGVQHSCDVLAAAKQCQPFLWPSGCTQLAPVGQASRLPAGCSRGSRGPSLKVVGSSPVAAQTELRAARCRGCSLVQACPHAQHCRLAFGWWEF